MGCAETVKRLVLTQCTHSSSTRSWDDMGCAWEEGGGESEPGEWRRGVASHSCLPRSPPGHGRATVAHLSTPLRSAIHTIAKNRLLIRQRQFSWFGTCVVWSDCIVVGLNRTLSTADTQVPACSITPWKQSFKPVEAIILLCTTDNLRLSLLLGQSYLTSR